MTSDFQKMTRQELLQKIDELVHAHHEEVMHLKEELEVHREELVAQHVQLQQTQAMLETSRDAYAELFDFAPVAYLSLDPNGLIQAINLTGCAFLERERARLIGMPLYSFFADRDKTNFLEHMRRCRSGENRIESELVLRTRTGNEVICLVTSRPDDHPATSYRTVLADITHRKRAAEAMRDMNQVLEEREAERTAELRETNKRLQDEIAQHIAAERALQEANQRKDDFLAMLGHELRNPLAPMRNASEILELSVAGNPNLEEIAEILKRQTSHMTRIVDDLLDVARITRGKIVLQREVFDLRNVVSESTRDLAGSVEAKQLQLVARTPEQPVWVHGDVTRVVQILNNLLNNAVKFTAPGGSVTVDLTVDDAASACRLSVRDTGRGIEGSFLGRIFDTFSQAGDHGSAVTGGLGLGLAVVRGLVELHGGRVSAASPGIGHGTEVTVELPLASIAPTSTSHLNQAVVNGHHSILLIDDSHDSLRMLKTLLETLGQTVHTASDAESGLELAKTIRPEVIISDIGLPRMNGYGLARTVRSDNELRSTFLVALTGYGRPQDLRKALDAGFDRHITKPVGLDELEEIVAGLGKRDAKV